MELKNGYKVLYDKVDGDERVILASKTGSPEGAEEILRTTMGEYKLIYQDAEHKIRGSVTGIPAADDTDFDGKFDKVFVEDTGSEDIVEPDNGEDEGTDEPQIPEGTDPEEEPSDEPVAGDEEPTVDETEA